MDISGSKQTFYGQRWSNVWLKDVSCDSLNVRMISHSYLKEITIYLQLNSWCLSDMDLPVRTKTEMKDSDWKSAVSHVPKKGLDRPLTLCLLAVGH